MLQLKTQTVYSTRARSGLKHAANYWNGSLSTQGNGRSLVRLQRMHSTLAATSAVTVPREAQSVVVTEPTPTQTNGTVSSGRLRDLTPEELQELIQSDSLVCIDYYTNWCGPCKMMDNEFNKLSKAFTNIHFAKFNCGTYEDYATQHRIRSLPTFRLYQRGRCLDQITGARPVQLRQLISHYYRPF